MKANDDVTIETNQIRSRIVARLDASRDRLGLEAIRRARATIAGTLSPAATADETREATGRVATAMPSPFAEDGLVTTIAGLTVENRTDEVSVTGHAVYPHGSQGRRQWLDLIALLDLLEGALAGEANLPDRQAPDTSAVTTAPNPFE